MNYNTIIQNEHVSVPCAFVDLESFDMNCSSLAEMVKGTPFTIRIATKSIRIPDLIRRALNFGAPFKGLMCYSAQEILYLSSLGFDDFLLAYPTVQKSDLEALKSVHQSGKKVTLVIDCVEHLKHLSTVFTDSAKPFPILIEPDLSLRFMSLVIGVRRSPLRDEASVLKLAQETKKYPGLRLSGIMAYEAHVAGVPDRNPFKKVLSPILFLMRRFAAKEVTQKRAKIVNLLIENGFKLDLVNGGGTGSISFNHDEKVLTEVTAGSGLFCSHLFDYYSNLHLKPSAFFALQVVRRPEEDWVTCLGGGYIASGEPGWDRVPKTTEGELSGLEATGEVQTPVKVKKNIGETIIFRHAKAGELAERFNEFHLISKGKIIASAKTYRGSGQCYL